jgi:DNA-binding XRE family transcriptional regulator
MTLTEARTRSGMNVPALARQLGVSRQHLYDIESGRRAPSRALAVKIVETFPTIDLLSLLRSSSPERAA